jgi:hypothetical protein
MIRILWLLLLIAGLWSGDANAANQPPVSSDEDNPAPFQVYIYPGDPIQSVIEEYPPGTTFIIGRGIHRHQTFTPRDGDIFIGESGAILNGSNLITEFVEFDDMWIIEGQTQGGREGGECMENFPRCRYAEDLFLDDVPLQHVASRDQVGPGRWYFDYPNDRVFMGDDPTGRKVEVSATYSAIIAGGARDVIIRNLIIEKYAGPGQVGAIRGNDSVNWLVENNTVRLNHGVGIVIGDGMIVRRNLVTTNGQMGVSGMGNHALIEENEISFNNYAGFLPAWESGGVKLVGTTGVIVRRNYSHHNIGPGLWTDYNNIDVLFEDNIVVHNHGPGIFHEISFDATIRRNHVMFNYARSAPWFFGSQILVSSSRNTQIYENHVVVSDVGGNAITVVQQGRGVGLYGEFFATDNVISNNSVVFMGNTGIVGVGTDWEVDRFWREAVNTFENNVYYLRSEYLDVDFWAYERAQFSWQGVLNSQQERGSVLVPYLPSTIGDIPTWPYEVGAS